jgi:tetratricopeptide (TPR) repeat protein
MQANNSLTQHQAMQLLREAHQYFGHGEAEEAKRRCHEILQALPRQADAIHLLGVIALKDGDVEKASQYFLRAIKLNGKHPQYLSNYGLALHEQGKLQEAEGYYRKAIALDKHYVDAYYNLHALLIKKDIKQAMQCLQQVLNINGQDHEAAFMLQLLREYIGGTAGSDIPQFAGKDVPQDISAKLDAWAYFKALPATLPALLGSNIDTFRVATSAAKLKGLVLEFGVRHGTSIRQLVQLVQQEVHGFDSFEGLPEDWHDERKEKYSTKGVIPKVPPLVKLHPGWFSETLPAFLKMHPQPVKLVNIDCDIYSSTKEVLDLLASQIVPGTVIIFDEYIGNTHWRDDEFKAFQEAVARYRWQYEYLSFSFFTKQVSIRIQSIG